MPERTQSTTAEPLIAIVRLSALLLLSLWLFRPQFRTMIAAAGRSSDTAHLVIAPFAVLALFYLRRRPLAANITAGSMWGIALMLLGLVLHALAYWPFPYGYAHFIAIIPVVAGIVLLACGWRVLALSLPLIFILFLAFPIGSRLYASLILRPNTYTLRATAATLDATPGLDASVDGGDLVFTRNGRSGVVGMGEANRAARLLFAYALIGAFVLFSRIRSRSRVLFVAILALPLLLLCNFLRFLCWALITVYGHFSPTSPLPRDIATVTSLFLAWGIFALVCSARLNLFVEDDAAEPAAAQELRT